MTGPIHGDLLNRLFQVQRDILSAAKDTDALLAILSQGCRTIIGGAAFGLLFYDSGTKSSRVRFNDGFANSRLDEFVKRFDDARTEGETFQALTIPVDGGFIEHLLPLTNSKGESYGVMLFKLPKDAPVLAEYSEICSDALSRTMEMEINRLQMAELATLLEVGKAVSSTLDLTELLKKIMAMATKVMRCETATVYLVDKKTRELYFN
ncbi:MAG TPA: hypothetical protein PKO06_21300, partial [Candidatus Ozemobacteraceae bacterium]|nr:hypothetical protein [Candidatus Ozemobacteraceae bacterium]